MPNNIVKSFAKRSNKSVEEVEGLWDRAVDIADYSDKTNQWSYIVGILKKMLKLKESLTGMDKYELLQESIIYEESDFDGKKLKRISDIWDKAILYKGTTILSSIVGTYVYQVYKASIYNCYKKCKDNEKQCIPKCYVLASQNAINVAKKLRSQITTSITDPSKKKNLREKCDKYIKKYITKESYYKQQLGKK